MSTGVLLGGDSYTTLNTPEHAWWRPWCLIGPDRPDRSSRAVLHESLCGSSVQRYGERMQAGIWISWGLSTQAKWMEAMQQDIGEQ